MSRSRDKEELRYDTPSNSLPVFQNAICECPDINASTMAVDGTGRFAMVSGRKSMGLIDLEGDGVSGTNQAPSGSQAIPLADASVKARQSPTCRRFIRNSKYEPTSSHFNRHITDLYALSTYQIVEIFSLDDINALKPKLTLKGHSRAIADIEWSHHDPHLLGSSAADCLTNIWDIRDSRRPSASLTSVSGATQVRFCKTSSNLIATSHEIDVRIWDIRQPSLPLNYIAAHLQKINGMDWNPIRSNCDHDQLITCSQDNTIKLWDLTTSKIRPSAQLQTRTPAWRVRFTPVSPYAIVTSTLPQLRSRTECMALRLWSTKSSRFEQKKLELILGLVGHTDVIIDFDWRHQTHSTGSCEIVSWSKDQTLRVWRVDKQFIEMNVDNSDYEHECVLQANSDQMSTVAVSDIMQTSEGNQSEAKGLFQASPQSDRLSSLRGLADSSPVTIQKSPSDFKSDAVDQANDRDDDDDDDESSRYPLTTTNELRQEFNLINKNIPNVEFEELNSLRRVCMVVARSKNITCRLRIALPPSYPHNEYPTFTIIESNQYGMAEPPLSPDVKEKLINSLNETAKAQLARSRNCIEPCLRKFIATLQKITSNSSFRRRGLASSIGQTGSLDHKEDPITLSAQRDHSVPFPPTSGARFCGNLLVCFGRPMLPTINNASSANGTGGETTSYSVETPRSMAQLSAQLDNMRRQGSYNLSHISISYFYYGATRRAELQSRTASSNLRSSNSSGIGATSRTSTVANGGSSLTSKYLTNRGRTSAHSMWAKNFKCGPVLIYDVSNMLGGISKELAEAYVFDKDVIKMCRRNAEIAAAHNRRDLVQIWSLAELSSEGVLRSHIPSTVQKNQEDENCPARNFLNSCDSDFGDRPWTMHPFGSKLIQSLIDHYVYNCHDVQTAAMLVWTFSSQKPSGRSRVIQQQMKLNQSSMVDTSSIASISNPSGSRNIKTYSEALGNGGSDRLHTTKASSIATTVSTETYGSTVAGSPLTDKQISTNTLANDAISDEWNLVNGPESHLYSNSWSNSIGIGHDNQTAPYSYNNDKNPPLQVCASDVLEERYLPRLNILSPDKSLQNDLIMHIYAEFLYRLNLLNQRAMVLKNIGSNSAYSEIFGDKRTLPDAMPHGRIENLMVQCANSGCRQECRSVQCNNCKKYSFYCSICRLPVKGSCSICENCSHGGHVDHFSAWFETHDFCPTGCGCKCPSMPQLT